MSVVDRHGLRITMGNSARASRDTVEKARDITIVRLRAAGQSWRRIGAYIGLSYGGARKRWLAIPVEVREHYGRQEAVG